jgi:methanethiol oxidase
LDPESAGYGRIVGQTDLAVGDELHHFGWNACSSCMRASMSAYGT